MGKKAGISTKSNTYKHKDPPLSNINHTDPVIWLGEMDLTKSEYIGRLEVFHIQCLQQILYVAIRDRIQNEVTRNRFNQSAALQSSIESEILLQRRLRWFGHVCRMDDKRLLQRLLWRRRLAEWKSCRTAPKKTRLTCIKEDLPTHHLSVEETRSKHSERPTGVDHHWKRRR